MFSKFLASEGENAATSLTEELGGTWPKLGVIENGGKTFQQKGAYPSLWTKNTCVYFYYNKKFCELKIKVVFY